MAAIACCSLAGGADAVAGTYVVRQCDAAAAGLNPAAEDAIAATNTASYATRDRCGADEQALLLDNLEPAAHGRFAEWRYPVPAGSELIGVELHARLIRHAGHAPTVFVGDRSSPAGHVLRGSDTNGWERVEWSAAPGAGREALAARLRCNAADAATCAESPSATARIRNVRLTVNDAAAPRLLLDGPLAASGWRSGTQALAVSAEDDGGGVSRIEVEVNGTDVGHKTLACATIPDRDQVSRMQPCAPDALASFDFDTSTAPFTEGQNSLEVCAEDFGSGSVNRTCVSRLVRVDNEGPGPPQNLHVIGGDDWRPVNDFDIAWENPEQPEGASEIAGAWWEIRNKDDHVVVPSTFTEREDIRRLDDLVLPDPGIYSVRVLLADAAGNANETDGVEVPLRFDDVPPRVPQAVLPAGWLSRRELVSTYTQSWLAPSAVPVSGLDGYAVAVDRFATTNPCETAQDPDPSICVGSEITHLPNGPLEQSLSDIPEGSSFVHIAAASGSGLRSTTVEHVEVKADRTDPQTELLGVPSGWTNEAPTLVARATDALSGMQPQPGDDGDPRTALRIDGGPVISDPDNEVVYHLDEEGDHEVRYWARDLAGNENDGDPGGNGLPPNAQTGVARVKLDTTPPDVAFTNAQDPADPELVRAPVNDLLSGLATGQIAFRPEGSQTWTPLATDRVGNALEARMSSDALPDGRYELRVIATDHAGNQAMSTQRMDGSQMILELPLKTGTDLQADLGKGRDRLKVPFGRRARVDGRLVTAEGEALGGEVVEVTETFDLGSSESHRTREAITDGEGRYALVLPAGPSREVEVEFAGSPSLDEAESEPLDLGVKSGASLGASERRPEVGRRFRFHGRVKRSGAHVPPGGKLVELQVRRPEGWDTVRQAFRTQESGRWKFPFRFGPYYAEPTTFRFRLKVVREADWPYRPVTTRRQRITVRPRD